MHRRGNIETLEKRTVTRGSVWVEQEIAVAAFMSHVLGRSIPTFFYKELGISLEGIRSVLLMNPRVEFNENSQVLEDLERALSAGAFSPLSEYDIAPLITYRVKNRGGGEEHTYEMTADVKNIGSQRITDFLMHVFFPRAFLNPYTAWAAEDKKYSTETHVCFVADQQRAPSGLYPGHTLRNPLTIEYSVNHQLFHDPVAMRSQIIVELFSGVLKETVRAEHPRISGVLREFRNRSFGATQGAIPCNRRCRSRPDV